MDLNKAMKLRLPGAPECPACSVGDAYVSLAVPSAHRTPFGTVMQLHWKRWIKVTVKTMKTQEKLL